MSVVSSRTKTSSILKRTSLKSQLTQVGGTPTKVRFELPHTKKVKLILKDFARNGERREYEQLICLIRDSILYDEDISRLLKESSECISLLNQDLRLFVEVVLTIPWTDKNKIVVREYQSFIVNLISAHNYHAEFVIDSLVALFLPVNTEVEWENGVPSKEDQKKSENVHQLLNAILTAVPMCNEILMHSLINKFPYLKKSAHIHEFYIQNLLWVLVYQPNLRANILHLIFSKLIILDVHAPREDIEKFNNSLEDEENIFAMDEENKSQTPSFHPVAHTLDVCLDRMFSYLVKECHEANGDLNWTRTKSLYHDMLTVFDKVILPTYNTHHVQFVMFVLCTFKSALCEAFFNYLWKKVCNPNVPSVIRQASIYYMISFLARATFISLEMMKGTLQQMAEWIHGYIATQDGLECVNSDVRIHSVFYAVCQALFYLVAFRHKDLIKTKKNIVFLESLNMAKIVTCRLNPLRVCQPAVVQNFAAITRKYQLAYCYSIIEHNSRNIIPTVYRDEKGSIVVVNSVIEAFYPFDPYILPRSSEKIHPYYRNYKEVKLESAESDVEMKDLADTDDFLEQEMKTDKFSYGTSPGFKFKG